MSTGKATPEVGDLYISLGPPAAMGWRIIEVTDDEITYQPTPVKVPRETLEWDATRGGWVLRPPRKRN